MQNLRKLSQPAETSFRTLLESFVLSCCCRRRRRPCCRIYGCSLLHRFVRLLSQASLGRTRTSYLYYTRCDALLIHSLYAMGSHDWKVIKGERCGTWIAAAQIDRREGKFELILVGPYLMNEWFSYRNQIVMNFSKIISVEEDTICGKHCLLLLFLAFFKNLFLHLWHSTMAFSLIMLLSAFKYYHMFIQRLCSAL